MNIHTSPRHAAPPRVRTAIVRCKGVAQTPIRFPAPAASVWRGLLGRWLHRRAGGTGIPDTVYRSVFATPEEAVSLPDLSGRSRATLGLTGPHRPHPYLLCVPDAPHAKSHEVPAGGSLMMELTILGAATTHLPILREALEATWQEPLGAQQVGEGGAAPRGRATLQAMVLDVDGLQWRLFDGQRWYHPPVEGSALFTAADTLRPVPEARRREGRTRVHVTLTSPLRAKHRGQWVRPGDLTPAVLSALLLRRLGALSACYTDHSITDADVDAWRGVGFAMGEDTRLVAEDLHWVDTFRYSGRQSRPVPAGGITGRFSLEGPTEWITHWQYLLAQAEQVHLGKGTSFGHGGLAVR